MESTAATGSLHRSMGCAALPLRFAPSPADTKAHLRPTSITCRALAATNDSAVSVINCAPAHVSSRPVSATMRQAFGDLKAVDRGLAIGALTPLASNDSSHAMKGEK
jgi:hypothetical protein